jgi:hypothetical protein
MRIPSLPAALLAVFFPLSFPLSAQAADWLYLTVPGDTLSEIGQTYLKSMRDWPKVQAANGVPIPERLPANTRIKIPVELLKVTPAPVMVTAVTGNVRYKPEGGRFEKLTAGAQLSGGESVLSGPRSSATYRFADGTVLTQQATSKLTFGRLMAYGKTGMVSTELSLDSGRLEARAGKQLAPAGGFRVRTPIAVAGLRGTDFRLNVSEDGKFLRNEVTEGAVGVAAQGREVKVEAGFGTLAEAGKPPEPPRALLPAPAADGLALVIERLPLSFAWQAVPDAAAYRAQVARDATFTEVLLDDVVTVPGVTWRDNLPDGRYQLRLRAIDRAGLEGANRDHAFELDAVPLPPAPQAPTLGERLYRHDVAFSWAAAAEAHGYVLQIAPTPEFDNGLIERRLAAVTRHDETLAEGDWHWRAASLDEAGKLHAWSPHRAFHVQPLPNPPAARASAEAGQAHFTWSEVKGAARYGLELGASADLSAPLLQRETDAITLAEPLKSGKYYWRVRAIEADGQAGAWGGISPVFLPPEAPSDLAVQVTDGDLVATWKGVAASWKVELSADASFAKPLLSQLVGATRATLPKPEAGDYWLRVRGMAGEGIEGPASAPVAVKVDAFTPWWLVLPLLLIP